jgi:hypothetical protein
VVVCSRITTSGLWSVLPIRHCLVAASGLNIKHFFQDLDPETLMATNEANAATAPRDSQTGHEAAAGQPARGPSTEEVGNPDDFLAFPLPEQPVPGTTEEIDKTKIPLDYRGLNRVEVCHRSNFYDHIASDVQRRCIRRKARARSFLS